MDSQRILKGSEMVKSQMITNGPPTSSQSVPNKDSWWVPKGWLVDSQKILIGILIISWQFPKGFCMGSQHGSRINKFLKDAYRVWKLISTGFPMNSALISKRLLIDSQRVPDRAQEYMWWNTGVYLVGSQEYCYWFPTIFSIGPQRIIDSFSTDC